MHELFITGLDGIPGAELKNHLKIFQGICGMVPVHKYERIITWEGPEQRLVPIPATRINNRRPQDREPWNQLNKQLSKQSYYINAVYAMNEEDIKGEWAEEWQAQKKNINLDEVSGTLNFLEYPDPTYAKQAPGGKPMAQSKSEPPRPLVNSRMVIRIKDEPKLPSLFSSISYKFRSERIQEAYTFYRDNVTVTLSRDFVRANGEGGKQAKVLKSLPTLDECVLFDESNQWLLRASVEVTEEKAGPLMQRGTEELVRLKKDLVGFHELALLDRDVFDTRVRAFLDNARRR